MNYAMWRPISMIDSGYQLNFEDMKGLYDKARVESILRTFLVHLVLSVAERRI